MTTLQKEHFLYGEGDAWYRRNKAIVDYGPDDPIIRAIKELSDPPKAILEIGCSDGGRLRAIKEFLPSAKMSGVEPSVEALLANAVLRNVDFDLVRSTADDLPFNDSVFDLVIFGFCLYLLDRSDLFKAVAEADRVLADKGNLIIYDFQPQGPRRRPYKHLDGVTSFKMDYPDLFCANPAYEIVRVMWHKADTEAATTLHKDVLVGYREDAG